MRLKYWLWWGVWWVWWGYGRRLLTNVLPCPMTCKWYGRSELRRSVLWILSCSNEMPEIYKYIINFLFDVTITNSFILYNISHDRKMKSLKFWEMLALELIGNYCTRKRAGCSRSRTICSLPMLHFPARFPTDHGHKRGKCALCRENKKKNGHTMVL